MMPSVSFYHFPARGTFYGLRTLEEAIEAVKEDGFVWFNFYKPERNTLNALIEPLGIHPLSIEDCFDEKQIPKIEHFPENTFIIFNSFMYINSQLFVDEIDLFIGKKFLVTLSGYNSLDREPMNNLTGVLESGKMNIKGGPDILMHKILDFLVDEKYTAFDILEDELEESEELLLRDVQQFDPMQLLHIRRSLMSLRKSLFHEREILIKILRMDCPFVSAKSIVLYRDVFDHLEKFFELTETLRVIETSLMELFSSLLNNYMTKVSNETNTSMRRLTLIATIFMPLTLIASIGGMSEWTMITGPQNWKISYPLFILGMAVIAAINFVVIRKLEKRKPRR
ncbi:MAG TPA: magnesium transporter CorA family protein [Bacteroidales bacterium]|nr:magnesium transporter CorA family protein [Bacteroidales bacterium]